MKKISFEDFKIIVRLYDNIWKTEKEIVPPHLFEGNWFVWFNDIRNEFFKLYHSLVEDNWDYNLIIEVVREIRESKYKYYEYNIEKWEDEFITQFKWEDDMLKYLYEEYAKEG